ncbi:MAG: ATPase, T2SS/T4P/T4SS family [Micavibrio sp.]
MEKDKDSNNIAIGGEIDISGLSIDDMDMNPSIAPVPPKAPAAPPAEAGMPSMAPDADKAPLAPPAFRGNEPPFPPEDLSGMGFIDDSHLTQDMAPDMPPPPPARGAATPEPQPAPPSAPAAPPVSSALPPAAYKESAEEGAKGRIGEKLVAMGLITVAQLNVALQEKKLSGKMLGEVLVDLGFITDDALGAFLAEASGFEVFDPKTMMADPAAIAILDKNTAAKYQVLPVSVEENIVRIAMADPYDIVATDILRRVLPKGMIVKPMVATAVILSDAIEAAYGYASKVNDILKELEGTSQNLEVAGLSEEEAFTHPIVRLVNALISEAVKTRASDLHFEPEENFVRLRYRVDGDLFNAQILHKQHWNAISQRLKIMANLNIADKLAPQDGRININVGGKEIDFRVSSLPTVHGENIVMRVLDKNAGIKPLQSLGFSEHNLKRIELSLQKPEGIIIVTGPTGSGKTTSLYSMLNEINTVDINIQTLEDPVEYSLPMIRQTPVREGILEFADGIRALLRQDPDVIFIGEIRDKTTATMALQAAMTGHQVFTTLHTNDSFGALPRLLDLGLVPGMIAGNIVSIFAQRLVRVLCPQCKQPYTPSEEERHLLGLSPDKPAQICKAREGGCSVCGNAGYRGRIAVAEILLFDEDMDEVVARSGTKAELKNMAVEKGFKSMKDDGILKVIEGVTSLEALSKVVDIRK